MYDSVDPFSQTYEAAPDAISRVELGRQTTVWPELVEMVTVGRGLTVT